MYPLIENAIRGARSRPVARHMQAMGRLLAGLAQVAERNPLTTRGAGYSAERLATVDHENRWIGLPYPRLMNANAFIDQAAIIMTSVGENDLRRARSQKVGNLLTGEVHAFSCRLAVSVT
jgi:acetyl-CoA C-acetyltransferase